MNVRWFRLSTLLLFAVLIGCRNDQAQPSTSAKRAPGALVTVAWDYPVASESKIRGFALKQAASREGPYRTLVKIARDQRKVEFEVSYEPGKDRSYYVVVALEGDSESAATNVIEIQKK
jgi:hypothetical protein